MTQTQFRGAGGYPTHTQLFPKSFSRLRMATGFKWIRLEQNKHDQILPSAVGWHGCLALDTVWVVWRRCADVGMCVCVRRRWHHSNADGFINQALFPTKTVLSHICSSLPLPDCVHSCEASILCVHLSFLCHVKWTPHSESNAQEPGRPLFAVRAQLDLWAGSYPITAPMTKFPL